jgi:hypothetical protein
MAPFWVVAPSGVLVYRRFRGSKTRIVIGGGLGSDGFEDAV